MSEVVGITGASSLIAIRLAEQLVSQNYEVVLFGRGVKSKFSLHPFELNSSKKLDVLIHLAWDFSAKDYELVNYQGSAKLIEWAQENNVVFIFISSLSAFRSCRSVYGKTKFSVEEIVLKGNGIVIKPGLIYSVTTPFGITGSIRRIVNQLPFVPVVGFDSLQYPIELEEVVKKIHFVIAHRDQFRGKRVSIRGKEPMKFGEYLRAQFPEKILIRIHWRILYFLLKIIEFFGLKIGLRSDSLIGLINYDTQAETYERVL